MFGSPETTPGGRALKFYASVRLDIRRIETLKDGAEAYGNRTRVKVVKNKVAPPFRQAEFDVIYGHGISWEGTVLDVGIEKAVVQKSGSFLSFEEERIGQGREKAKAFLREHPEVTQRILNRIQAVTEGSIIPGATVPAPGKAIGEVAADAPVPTVAPEPEEPAASNGVPVGVGGDA
jgi:recombination protein RecA